MSVNSNRGEFSSKFAFIMAAAGSAIGLGNIWGFPGQTASNGGAAFVVVYLILAFILAYPALMAEYIIGRYSRSNIIGAFDKIEGGKPFRFTGYAGVICSIIILSFYSVVAGWVLSYVFHAIVKALGFTEIANWAVSQGTSTTIIFTVLFSSLTVLIVLGGVKNGIEKWSSRLMPMLIFILILLIIYVLTLDGAMEGLKHYLLPDWSKVLSPNLILSAMGQAFFSLSLGVGTMLVYGSYISKKENLASIGISVTFADIGIAFLAGLLIIPAMFVASKQGVQIYDTAGALIAGPNIVFQVLPALFNNLGNFGIFLTFVFFTLMSIASVTSSISLLEVPVSHAVDDKNMDRRKATFLFGAIILVISVIIALNVGTLLGLAVQVSTQWIEPIVGLLLCIFVGWVMNRNEIIKELKEGYPEVEQSLFIKIWPIFVKIVCPILILTVFLAQFF
jgi:neurotransmitter:Na+ symporter, NSS family